MYVYGNIMSDVWSGRVALIAGATGSLGVAVSRRFAKDGAHVVLIGRDVDRLGDLHDEIRNDGGKVTLAELDLCDFAMYRDLVTSIGARFGKIDAFIFCAGILGELSPLQDIDLDVWQNVLNVNLTANWLLLKYCDPLLRLSDAGRVVIIGSDTTACPESYPYWGAYAVSKAGTEVMARIYASETRYSNVRVNIVSFGLMQGGVCSGAFPGKDKSEFLSPDVIVEKILECASPNFKDTGTCVCVDPRLQA